MNEKIIKKIFPKTIWNRQRGLCAICSKEIKMLDFKDDLSIKEYKISGLCQKCQDNIFKSRGKK